MYDSLINVNGNQVPTLDLLLILTIISLLPSLLVMVTSFARTVIILSFLRNAMGVQQTPPNMVLIGIAVFLTVELFADMADAEEVEQVQDLPMTVVIPAFMTSELKRGFSAGFLLYIPFLLIDIVVSSTLMSMGMMMLPPAMISLPFKLLFFVTVNGWEMLF